MDAAGARRCRAPQLRTYLTWRLVSLAGHRRCPSRSQDAAFAFRSKYLTGAKEDLPRWKKCVAATDQGAGRGARGALRRADLRRGRQGGDAGRWSKQIEQAFEREPGHAELDGRGHQGAARREKAQAVFNKIGYPDKWKTYDGLVTDRGTFLGNRMRSTAFENARDLTKIGKPLDRTSG